MLLTYIGLIWAQLSVCFQNNLEIYLPKVYWNIDEFECSQKCFTKMELSGKSHCWILTHSWTVYMSECWREQTLWRQCKKGAMNPGGFLGCLHFSLQCFSLVAVHKGSQKKDIFWFFGHGPAVCRGGQEIQGHPVLYQQYCGQGSGKISDGGA